MNAKIPLCLASLALISASCAQAETTLTPIKHLVIIFQENISFDHYFATYPKAANLDNEPRFTAQPLTSTVNGLSTSLLLQNPNALNPANGSNAINPFRLARSQASTCDQDHSPGYQQLAFNGGMMDLFPSKVGYGGGDSCSTQFSWGHGDGLVMGYFDGNTVTALWQYAQRYAMSDNFFGSVFGPSTLGALNLVAGNTYPAFPTKSTVEVVASSNAVGTLQGDLQPSGDKCSTDSITVSMGGKNVGDLLNAKGVSWGAFMAGFDLTVKNPDGSTGCKRQSPASAAYASSKKDYVAHHAWFQYYNSTANPNHTRPTVAPSAYGSSADKLTNHQYDLRDFFAALSANNLPAVSFLKAPAYQDGHAGYSDPLLEQQFLVQTINTLQQSPFWPEMAIIITYDDSDGWYDHQMSSIINPSAVFNANSKAYSDQLYGPGKCGLGTPLADDAGKPIQGRCGFGPRLPLLVISPFSKANYIDHTLTNQASVLRLIEDNWGLGRIGGGSFDAISNSLMNVFDFQQPPRTATLLLDSHSGNPQSQLGCLFDWAQASYPQLLAPAASTQTNEHYTYRYYAATNTYVGIAAENQHVYLLAPNNGLVDLGAAQTWLNKAQCP